MKNGPRLLFLLSVICASGCGQTYDILYINYSSVSATVYLSNSSVAAETIPPHSRRLVIGSYHYDRGDPRPYDIVKLADGTSRRIDYGALIRAGDAIYDDKLIIVELGGDK